MGAFDPMRFDSSYVPTVAKGLPPKLMATWLRIAHTMAHISIENSLCYDISSPTLTAEALVAQNPDLAVAWLKTGFPCLESAHQFY